ncbi:peptide-methionine (S)-S-oxide reductase MsrA [Paludisphaera borealis]|uniref:Peptide methionine sulfoxide reductase MsrA n=1 Tax=Paludisphaera borealis TaxID=1387353 RepID=A0A1U7CRE1_9BACT|nr:peptide-methionine (S)-S-oxide reductase MsrA [Paludisphaera borealis]APW61443.1 Peptide methionine sulfoxide reductase MsrA 2 [Paludisphaera borealis]
MSTLRRAFHFHVLLVVLGSTLAFAQDAKPSDEAPAPKADTKAKSEAKAKDTDKDKTDEQDKAKPAKPKIETATFGGGCFWCTEAVFERLPGVKSVVSGYSGGNVANPTYEMVSTGLTGHAEVIQIEYDANVVSFDKLLELFWHAHDPTTVDSQGPDFGPQYRSIILYHSEAQKDAAKKAIHDLNAKRKNRSSIATQVVPFEAFYPAEEYHQDYARNHRGYDYVETYITPKLRKLKSMLK